MIRSILGRTLSVLSVVLLSLAPAAGFAPAVANAASVPVHTASPAGHPTCDDNAFNCTEAVNPVNYDGQYTGHDEPSLLYYSNTPGSGNYNVYHMTLPKDPPTLPNQAGTAGTFNFQLHPAFWFGMALCDSQSAPNPGQACPADTDANIFDGANPAAADYIGKHPGTAFMEMQFYPPGWVLWPPGNSCDATKWCAALNIDSLSENQNTGQRLNLTCRRQVGLEYVNFAFITKNGTAQAPASPVNATLATFTPDPNKDLFMNSGDQLVVTLHDTPAGFQVIIKDKTTGQAGSMTASPANGFGQVQFDPTGTSCNNLPYAFHPMYSTSSEHTRVPWAAHSYNVAFSDEIGHFEYCPNADANGNCSAASASDPGGPDGDDFGCFNAADSSRIQIGGCLGTDIDFDGVNYQLTWPGSLSNRGQDQRLNPRPIIFSSPLFKRSGGDERDLQNFSRVAFETDLPRIEAADFGGNCDRSTGANCVNPPPGANFYPFFSTRGGSNGEDQGNVQANNQSGDDGRCLWQLGGANIPGTKNTFGGNSTAEFGTLLKLTYPNVGGTPVQIIEDFRQVLSSNPCPAGASN